MKAHVLGALAICMPLSSMSCQQDYTFRPYDQPNLDATARLIQLQPSVLNFGQTAKQSSAWGNITVENIGFDTLYLEDISVSGSSSFSAQAPALQFLEPGEQTLVAISYNPFEFESTTGELLVNSSDPILPQATVGLAGRSAPPEIAISPVAFDFGLQFIGCTLDHYMTVYNYGEGALQIESLGLADNNEDFRVAFDPPTSLPLVLEPGESWDLVLDYRPSSNGSHVALVQIGSNDPANPVAEAQAYGQGRSEGHVTDQFDQLANNQTDILFIVDNSYSMLEEQETLICNFQSFLDIVEDLGINYHIGVVTTDSPILSGQEKVITPTTIDPAEVFAKNATVGTGGQGQEQGYEMAKQALSDPLISTQNQGFLRDEAGLRLIFVSDEDDQSQGEAQDYLSAFRKLKASLNQLVISAIVGDKNTGCGFEEESKLSQVSEDEGECPSGFCGRAIAGNRYLQSVDGTGGIFGSICSCNFIEALENIAYETVHRVDTFFLSQTPRPDTIEVWVDDEKSQVWQYDEAANAIIFSNPLTVPLNGSRIRIEYDLLAFCSD